MPTERVAILLPCFDAEATLAVALESLVRQRFLAWHCVVVDDGSTDGSAAIARAFAQRDPRIQVIERAHQGLLGALATGLEACRAPFVARMDADDWMHADRLSRQIAALEGDPGLAAVGCHVRLFPRAPLKPGRRAYERWLASQRDDATIARDRFIECPVAHPTWLVRREVFDAFPYEDHGWPEDWDWLLRVHAAGHRFGVVPARLHAWRDEPGRLSRTERRYSIERFTECRAAHLARDFLRDADRYVLWGHGGTGRALRRALERFGKRPKRIVEVHPGRIGQRIHGVDVVEPDAIARETDRPLVASVAGADARAKIRAALEAKGFVEGVDFVCAA